MINPATNPCPNCGLQMQQVEGGDEGLPPGWATFHCAPCGLSEPGVVGPDQWDGPRCDWCGAPCDDYGCTADRVLGSGVCAS